MKIKIIDIKIVNPKMPAATNGLLVISSGDVNSVPLTDGRIVINNGTISTVAK